MNRAEDFYSSKSARKIFSKDVSFENSFTIESEQTTSPSARGDVRPSTIR